MNNSVKITFFMIVTDPDIGIADYAVKSYSKVQGISFKLRIYSNWVSPHLKERYFPIWRSFNFVEIEENEWQKDKRSLQGNSLEGPYEKCFTVWDSELKKIQTPYFATVDADFEILDAKFISVMLNHLEKESNVVAMATDYQPRVSELFDSYNDENIAVNERLQTWFCIYEQKALECHTSHRKLIVPSSPYPEVWDEGGYFQKMLKEEHGYDLSILDQEYQPCFIHYGAFSKNRDVNDNNIFWYRTVNILGKRGLFGSKKLFIDKAFRFLIVNYVIKFMFGNFDRTKYWNRSKIDSADKVTM
jgi:hypothetical protein